MDKLTELEEMNKAQVASFLRQYDWVVDTIQKYSNLEFDEHWQEWHRPGQYPESVKRVLVGVLLPRIESGDLVLLTETAGVEAVANLAEIVLVPERDSLIITNDWLKNEEDREAYIVVANKDPKEKNVAIEWPL